jgi:hypothetical protein
MPVEDKPKKNLNVTQEKLLDNFADQIVDGEEIHERHQVGVRERLQHLLDNPDDRDERYFDMAVEQLGPHVVDLINLSYDDFFDVPVQERNFFRWTVQLAQLVSILRTQAIAESGVLIEAVEAAGKYTAERAKLSKSLNLEQLREVSADGINKNRIRTRKERRNGKGNAEAQG